jgi:membrane associated rhomboid family serine protease
MREKYRGLVICSKVLKVVAIVVVAGGIVVSLAGLSGEGGGFGAVLGICYSLLYGVLLYSFSEVIKLLLDIGTEIGDKNRGKEGEKVI